MNTEYQTGTSPHPRSQKSQRFRLLTFAALEIWWWFGMADLDYQIGSLFPFRTAGWFVISQIFVIPFFGIAVIVIEFLFERWPRLIGILVSVGAGTLLGVSIYDALPQQQLSRLIGPELAHHCKIERMQATDSFGDGITYEGTLLIGPEFTKILQAGPNFEKIKRRPAEQFHPGRVGTSYRSNRAELRIVPDGKICVFQSRYTPPNPKVSSH